MNKRVIDIKILVTLHKMNSAPLKIIKKRSVL